jgi:hypothetical protein
MNDPVVIAEFIAVVSLLTHFPRFYLTITSLVILIYFVKMARTKREMRSKPSVKAKPGDVVMFFTGVMKKTDGDLLNFLNWKCFLTLFTPHPTTHFMVALGDGKYTDVRRHEGAKVRGLENKWDDEVGVIPMNMNLQKREFSENGEYWNYGGCYPYARYILKTYFGQRDLNFSGREIFSLDYK